VGMKYNLTFYIKVKNQDSIAQFNNVNLMAKANKKNIKKSHRSLEMKEVGKK
jgi:hypothetical protein